MKLHEEVSRIKSIMGVLTEDEVTFPITVSDNYSTAKDGKGDCDTFHSFNDNGKKEIGGMNTKVNKSEDGNAWIGLYSRGGGAISEPGQYPDTLTTTNKHTSVEAAKTSPYIKKRGTVDKMVPVKIFTHSPKKGCRVKQIFYKYTLNEYPTLEEKVETPEEEPIEKLPLLKPEPLQLSNNKEIVSSKPTTPPTQKKGNIISKLFNK